MRFAMVMVMVMVKHSFCKLVPVYFMLTDPRITTDHITSYHHKWKVTSGNYNDYWSDHDGHRIMMIIMITAILLSLKVVIYPLHAVALSGFPTDLTSGGSGGRCHTEHWGQNSVGSSMYVSLYHVSEACVIVSAKSQKCPSQTCNVIVSAFKSILKNVQKHRVCRCHGGDAAAI